VESLARMQGVQRGDAKGAFLCRTQTKKKIGQGKRGAWPKRTAPPFGKVKRGKGIFGSDASTMLQAQMEQVRKRREKKRKGKEGHKKPILFYYNAANACWKETEANRLPPGKKIKNSP